MMTTSTDKNFSSGNLESTGDPQVLPPDTAKTDRLRVVSITSGKGGVGKTNIAVNLAIALAKQGKRVMILDADLSLANVNILLGLDAPYDISDLLSGGKELDEIVIHGPFGIKIIPASSGMDGLATLTLPEKLLLLEKFDNFKEKIDILLVDTCAGIGSNVIYFTVASQEIIVVANPEPTSFANAYSMIKVLSQKYHEKSFQFIVNNARDEQEARKLYETLLSVSQKFLNVSVDYLGFIHNDLNLVRAVKNKKAVLEQYPDSIASRDIESIAQKFLGTPPPHHIKGNVQLFWQSLLNS
jgi:flagellar biosynthesis protein FlhG